MLRFIWPTLITLMLASSCFATTFIDCYRDPQRLQLRSQELQDIVKADQDDRRGPVNWDIVAPRDEVRRKRVGEIFGEGCMITAQDFAAAALVFQHGNTHEHNFQAFLWAKRAVELGDKTQKTLMASGIDRYLIYEGHKQLYGTQGYRPGPGPCHCLDVIEKTFPEKRRVLDADWSLQKGLDFIADIDKGKNCGKPQVCVRPLLPTPRGSVPGLW